MLQRKTRNKLETCIAQGNIVCVSFINHECLAINLFEIRVPGTCDQIQCETKIRNYSCNGKCYKNSGREIRNPAAGIELIDSHMSSKLYELRLIFQTRNLL